ncbi:MAG TPA: FtsX-like permease family protein [Desulfobacteria bacterium]|nr:FtsX-like permease family protein [Desulfobacteria bacterium]
MQLKDIALKNLQRRKSKMLFLVFGIVFGIATIVTLFTLTGAMEKSVSQKIQENGIKLAVVPKSESASFSVGGIPIVSGVAFNMKDIPAQAVNQIKSIPGADKIRVIAPKVMGTVKVGDRKVLLVGVDFPAELKIKSWWEIKGKKPEGKAEVLVGAAAAEKLKLTPGQKIDIKGRTLQVSGILEETGEEEDGIIFANLASAQEILEKKDKFSFVELTVVKDEKVVSALSGRISDRLPDARVKVVKEAAEARQELVEKFSRFSLVVSLVMVIIAGLIITTTMMGSVNERTREIGIFRAIGFRKAHITRIILLEAGVISGVSGLAGYIIGMAAAYIAAPMFANFDLIISWNLVFGAAILTGTILLGVMSSIYPASKASKLDPAEALRFI